MPTAFDSYSSPLSVLTIQAEIVALFPSSYNATLILIEAIVFAGLAYAILIAIRTKKWDHQLRIQKPLIVHDFAAFHDDFSYLTLTHLTRVLKHGIPSKPQSLRYVTLKDSIDLHTVQAQLVTPAVSSTAAPRPQHVELTLSVQATTLKGLTAHVFAHVSLSAVLSYLKAVDQWEYGERRFGPATLKTSLSLIRRVKEYALMGLKALCAFTQDSGSRESRADPIVQELLDVSGARRSHNVEPLLPASTPAPCDQALVALAQRHFSSATYRTCPLPHTNGLSRRLTFLVDPIYGQPANESQVHMVILLNGSENRRKRSIPEPLIVSQLVLLDGLNASSTFNHSLELLLHDASNGQRSRRPSAALMGEEMVGVSAQQAIYGLDDANDTDCLICLSCQKDAILLPCRHCAACVECLQGLFQDKCPICRSNFLGWIHLPWKTEQAAAAAAGGGVSAESGAAPAGAAPGGGS